MKHLPALAVVLTLLAAVGPAVAANPIAIVAAENFYGDVAAQIGGSDVRVTSILAKPGQDPHLFEASASAARAVSTAQIVIYSGIDYDPWMPRLLGAAPSADRRVIVVADVIGRKIGDNPHIWYDPATMLALAETLTEQLSAADAAHRADYSGRFARFRQSLAPVLARIAALRRRLAGTAVTATEPVFGYMFDVLGMRVENLSFQTAVMNGTEPSATSVAAFEDSLKTRRVGLLVYNRQVSDPLAERMVALARSADIPVVGVTETEPPHTSYQDWMMSVLDAVDHALRR